MLRAQNSSQLGKFYTRGRHGNLSVIYVSQGYFALPRKSIRNNCDRLILFKQLSRDVQNMYYDIGAYDMKFDEFRERCLRAWREKINYLCIDLSEKNEGKNRIFNENRNTYIECFCKTPHFLIT